MFIVLIVLFVITMYLLEKKYPLRDLSFLKSDRIYTNLTIALISFIVVKIVAYPLIFLIKLLIGDFEYYSLSLFLNIPYFVFSFLLLDYSQYIWHRINHKFKFFWNFHAIHHSDRGLDFSSSFRFHFGEMFLSQFFRLLIVTLFFIKIDFIFIYDTVSLFFIIFHHSNIKFKYDSQFSRVIVTPYMHLIHHSIEKNEYNSNYSVIFSFWDRLHKTLVLKSNFIPLQTGLENYQEEDKLKVKYLLMKPIKNLKI